MYLCGIRSIPVVLASGYANNTAEWKLEPPHIRLHFDLEYTLLRFWGGTLLQRADQGIIRNMHTLCETEEPKSTNSAKEFGT